MPNLSQSLNKLRNSFAAKTLILIAALHMLAIILLDKITAFAPDERNYIEIFNNLYKSDFSLEGYSGWNEGSIIPLRIIYAPAKGFNLIGFSDFYSVRFQTLTFTLATAYLLLKSNKDFQILKLSSKKWVSFSFFVPSVFLWTTLGLRESFILFFIVTIFYVVSRFLSTTSKWNLPFIGLASTGLLISKTYLYVLLYISFLLASVILGLRRQIKAKSLFQILTMSLIPLLIFPSITSNAAAMAKTFVPQKISQLPTTPGSTPTPTQTPGSTQTPGPLVESRGQTLHDLNEQLKNNQILFWIADKSGFDQILENASRSAVISEDSINAQTSNSKLKTTPASLRDPVGLGKGIINFLFIPAPFMDNGSFFLNLQSYESFAWYFIYIIFLILLGRTIRGQYDQTFTLISSTLFAMGFVIQSALVEINDGTSVRHRAVLLIAVLIMISNVHFEKRTPNDNSMNSLTTRRIRQCKR